MNKYIILFLCALCVACGQDPKKPSEANFRAAINEELKKWKNPYCISPSGNRAYLGQEQNQLLDALIKKGLLEEWKKDNWSSRFSPTDKSKDFFSDPSGRFFSICVAEGVEVGTIDNWIEPAHTATRVLYTYKPIRLAPWVTEDLEPFVEYLIVEKKDRMNMVLTAKGWQKSEF